MKESVISAGKWIVDIKWWKLIILYPAIITILGSSCAKGYEFINYTVLGRPNLSAIEKRNLEEFHRHWGEDPAKKESLEVNGDTKVDIAYYESDGCMLVTRHSKNSNPSMTWLPHIKEKLITYTDASDILSPNMAYAEMVPMSAHDGDMRFIDIMVGWISPYEFVMERRFNDGCVGQYQVWAPTGATCCWKWIRYRH